MIGIINKLYSYISPKKERHPVHKILETSLYNEAKAIVQEKIDNSNKLLEKLKVIERKLDNGEKLTLEELHIMSLIEI